MKKLRFFFLGLLFFSCSTHINEDGQTLLFLDNYDGISWVLRGASQPSGADCDTPNCDGEIWDFGEVFAMHSGDTFLTAGTNCEMTLVTLGDQGITLVSHTQNEIVWERPYDALGESSSPLNWPGESRLTVVGGQLKFYMTYPLVSENELIFIMDRVGIVDCNPN